MIGISLMPVDDPLVQRNFDEIKLNWRAEVPSAPVSSLPASPITWSRIHFQTSAMAAMSPPVVWELVYDGTKWIALGNQPLYANIDTAQATGGTAYADLTTAGPSLSIPVAGDYLIEHGTDMTGSAGGTGGWHSYDIGASVAVDGDASVTGFGSAGQEFTVTMTRKKTLAAVTLTSKYKHFGAAVTMSKRWLKVTPLRLG